MAEVNYAELAAIPDFQSHYVRKISGNSWSACLPSHNRAVYSVTLNMLDEVEFYARDDESAIKHFLSKFPNHNRLVKIFKCRVEQVYPKTKVAA